MNKTGVWLFLHGLYQLWQLAEVCFLVKYGILRHASYVGIKGSSCIH